MKVKNPNELWLFNRTASDVHLSDLGVKVPAGKAVNVYQVNPYLTTPQVASSREIGSLAKRLTSGVLVVVKKAVTNSLPPAVKNIQESKDSIVKAVKTKSSVILQPDEPVDEEAGEGFGFADYGVVDTEPPTQRVKQEDGLVTVAARQDDLEDPAKGINLKPTAVESGVSKQSQVVMAKAAEVITDPTGPHAETSTAHVASPFVVAKPPKYPALEMPETPQTPQSREEDKQAAIAAALAARRKEAYSKTPSGQNISKNDDGMVVVGGETLSRSIGGVKKAQDEGVGEYDPANDVVSADNAIKFEETPYDSKVATTTEDGAVVMKLKEDEDGGKPTKKKAVTKKKRASKKKK